MDIMDSGKALYYDCCWHTQCRLLDKVAYEKKLKKNAEAFDARIARQIECRVCGQRGESGSYPFSTLASEKICDNCY